ncbi:transcriptional regulator [Pontibacillus halophilus JSM 076056 = DSM 19796]|uniref:Transcriptional regulator n=1 Tax=Pontibacillus halophilus JSM 076056 = DSM 19796 TaxID=1385510 RepID=A0A0A5GQG6_9BACI|nr:response regulator transcription factor [Pontibacillus halophilus]KGX93415.1 transcriptional regulator [Pontibacillus halophilus JSM 076056 = DSM 19796]
MEDIHVLLVDDEPAIIKMVETVLRKEGYQSIDSVYTVADALEAIHYTSYDIILLDVMLPDGNGFELGPKIHEAIDTYIIYVTAKTSDLDVLTGFAVGGDDYVTKPFNPLEIAARIKAVHRRLSIKAEPTLIRDNRSQFIYDFDHFQVNERTKEVMVKGEPVTITALLFRLLLYLCHHPNQVFTKSDLFEAVWGYEHPVDDNTIMVHIRRLREKIEPDPSRPQFLITIRGFGYKLVKEPSR